MNYRKLRITWSVVCGVACLLLIVLCVRSYWRMDYVHCPFPGGRTFMIQSIQGRLTLTAFGFNPRRTGWLPTGWGRESALMTEVVMPKKYPQFAGGWDQFEVYVMFPHWIAIIGFSGLAAVPWLKWPARFSLRTLLIGMTLLAVGLGWAVYVTR